MRQNMIPHRARFASNHFKPNMVIILDLISNNVFPKNLLKKMDMRNYLPVQKFFLYSNIKQPQRLILPLKDNNAKWLKGDKEKANAFAEYLTNVFKPYSIVGNEEHQHFILDELFQMQLSKI